jgi:hypothetical protein
VEQGGLLLSDDCNHDVNGLYARSFEQEMRILFGARGGLRRLPNDHALYRAFFQLPDGPLATSHELNGWGDDLVHDYLQGVEHAGRLGVVYSNKDYGGQAGLRLAEHAVPARGQHAVRGEPRGVRDDVTARRSQG